MRPPSCKLYTRMVSGKPLEAINRLETSERKVEFEEGKLIVFAICNSNGTAPSAHEIRQSNPTSTMKACCLPFILMTAAERIEFWGCVSTEIGGAFVRLRSISGLFGRKPVWCFSKKEILAAVAQTFDFKNYFNSMVRL